MSESELQARLAAVCALAIIALALSSPAIADSSANSDVLLFGQAPDLVLGEEDGPPGRSFGIVVDIAVAPNGTIYVLDQGFLRVDCFSEDGIYEGSFGRAGEGPGDFSIPQSIAVDSRGHVYVGSRGGRIGKYSAVGEVLDDFRLIWPGNRDIYSIAVSKEGMILITCPSVLDQEMIHVLSPSGDLVHSFGETYAQGLTDVDTSDELTYAGGRLDLYEDTVVYTQYAPASIRSYSLDGALLREYDDAGLGGSLPPPVLQPNGTRVVRVLRGAVGAVVLADGSFLNVILVPEPEDGVTKSIVELYDSSGAFVRSSASPSLLQPKCIDPQGRVLAGDFVPFARVLRFPAPTSVKGSGR